MLKYCSRMAELRVLGPVGLLGDDGTHLTVGGPKERALLAVLACLRGQVASEERLVDALWANDPPRTARRTLQSYLSRLRRTLSTASADGGLQLESRPGGWTLQVGADSLDLSRVEMLVSEARAASERRDHIGAALSLRAALAEWRGRPLEEFADHAWAVLEGSRLQELQQSLVEQRVEAELACGRHADLIGELEVACHAHPLRERLWGLRMTALYRAGRQAEALRVYQELRTLLAQELGIDPSPSVSRLEQQILAHDPALDWKSPAQAPEASGPVRVDHANGVGPVDVALPKALGSLQTVDFVGRASELAELGGDWTKVGAEGSRVVFVSGEPGIGKTTLAAHLATSAKNGGAVVLFGRCDEENLVAFQPFLEAINHYVDCVSADRLRADLGSQVPDLALLIPGLGRRLAEVANIAGKGADTERYRIFEAVVTLFTSIAQHQPVVLMLDDLHWADRPTLGLLQHLIRGVKDLPVLILGTYRDTDLVRTQPLAEILVELRRAHVVSRIHLAGLVLGDVLDLVTAGSPHTELDVDLALALWKETEGSPLFLREILRHLLESGVITREDNGRYVALRRIDQLGIPEGVREAIGRRLSRLSGDANVALRCGSVLGREVRQDVVERVTEVPTDQLLDAMEEAVAAGILEEVPGIAGRWAFTHALVRQTLYEELSLSRRVRLHQRVGEALEAVEAGEGPHLAELAYHFAQAAVSGMTDKAIAYARLAGEYAIRLAAFEQAANHFASAVEVAEDASKPLEEIADLLLAQGHAEWRAGGVAVARAIFDRVIGLVGSDDPERLGLAALGYSGSTTRTWWVEMFVVNEKTIERLERALAALPEVDSPLRAQLLAALAQELYFDDQAAVRRETLSATALQIARRLGDPHNLALVINGRILAVVGPDHLDETYSLATELLSLAEGELSDPELAATALRLRVAFSTIDRLDETLEDLRRWEALITQLRDPSSVLVEHSIWAVIATAEARFDDAAEQANIAFQKGQAIRDRNAVGTTATCMAVMRMYQGRSREILPLAEASKEIYPRGTLWADALLAGGYAEAGELAMAAEYFKRLSSPNDLSRTAVWFFGMFMYARACYWLEDAEQAAECYELLAPFEDVSGLFSGFGAGSCQLPLAMAAAAAGQLEVACRHFETAIEQNAARNWHAPLTDATVHYGRFLSNSSDNTWRTQAVAILERGVQMAESYGMTRHLEIAREALARLTDPASVSLEPNSPPRMVSRRRRAVGRVAVRSRAVVARWTQGCSDEELVRRFGSGLAQRAVFAAMSRAFVPTQAYGFDGDVVLELRPPDDALDLGSADWWTIEVRGRRANARRGRSDNPAVVIHIGLATFLRIVAGEIHPVRALVEGSAEVDGDVIVAARLTSMFSAIGTVADQLVSVD